MSSKDAFSFRKCPLCNYKEYKRFIPYDAFVFGNNVYNIVVCEICGHVYQNPVYSKEHYHSLPCSYPKDYYKHSFDRANYIYKFFRRFIPYNPTVDILDIGAGKCEPIKYLLNNFGGHHAYKDGDSFRGTAITLESKENIFWGDKQNIDILNFDFENDDTFDNLFLPSLKGKKFDFIIMSHVLEHFIEPVKAIEKVKQVLAEDGFLYIEVPSLNNAEFRIKEVWAPEHLSYYTTASLDTMMVEAGFYPSEILDSKIWGNIKSVWQYNPQIAEHNSLGYRFINFKKVLKEFRKNYYKKAWQRMKHKIGFKYEANI